MEKERPIKINYMGITIEPDGNYLRIEFPVDPDNSLGFPPCVHVGIENSVYLVESNNGLEIRVEI